MMMEKGLFVHVCSLCLSVVMEVTNDIIKETCLPY